MDISVRTVDKFNKVLMEMTRHSFPAYAFCKQKRNLRSHPRKSGEHEAT